MKISDLKRLIAEELKLIMEERPEYHDRTGGLKVGLNPVGPYAYLAANPARAVDNPKDYKKTAGIKHGKLFASDWKDWPVEAQVNFCKQNKGKPTIDANGKRIPAPGPTCREILSVNEKKAAYLKLVIREEIGKIIVEQNPAMADAVMKELDAIANEVTMLKARLQKVMDSGALPEPAQPDDPRFSPDIYK
jgi:hypothetical protein